MKRIIAIALLASLTACSTVGGAVGGLGKDFKAGTDWVQSKVDPNSAPAK
jgi:predicted small secreted protein